jgi:SagB-type dehydrogenase family enzyme
MSWREYHQVTKHSRESLRRRQHALDWANMPDPYRHYEGVPLFDLPADPYSPEVAAVELLQGAYGATTAVDGAAFLSQLLFHSAAISASKRVPSTNYKYALRVNPSSGNLHPTEFHFLARGLKQWPDGVYHYRPSSHSAEQRATGDLNWIPGSDPIVFVLTSIAWREAWKYGDRAYRYCLHDMGHAWQSLALAARAMGCDSFAIGHFPDDEVAQQCRLHEDEWPMLVVTIGNATAGERSIPERNLDPGEAIWKAGRANELSGETIAYPLINEIHHATKLNYVGGIATCQPAPTGFGDIKLPPPASSKRTFGEAARMRRSALDFRGGSESISLPQLSAILSAATQAMFADFAGARLIQLYLYVHRVDSLQPGVYRLWPDSLELDLIRSGDQQVAAAGLSLGQDLAGNACVAVSMAADLERAARFYGDRGYRYAHFEAGAIGHRLYLAAEALGLGATGIGAFYDEEVNSYLNLMPEQGQVVYHFAIGHPVPDPRLQA